ncbi:MAG TPA: DUF5916 domain-containing protein [Gemmatimonadaceae bacterium]|nr:DUF5916 domain-containing protein [Gemmatimonadaceae bacterium]
MSPLHVAALVASVALRLLSDSGGPIYSGRAQQLAVAPPRVEAQPVVDGHLDEGVWRRAALLTGFSQFAPTDGVAAADSTEVLVWYSPTAIYFGVRAFEKHGPVHATLADRDKIDADDNVQILLGPFHDQRQALLFGVNPLGVQMDGTINEIGQAAQGWTPGTSARVAPDLSQDFVFTSKGRVTTYGYEVEIRIPFKSVKLQSARLQTWDINVIRQVQHSRYEDSWAPASRAQPSFLAQGGSLVGLEALERGLVLDVNPVVTQKVLGAPGPGGWDYRRQSAQFGGDLRWGITNNLTLNGTAHPDFAEVESDAGQFVIDPRLALFFPEKRPFFLDGMENFQTPATLIYTRRIGAPLAATKLAGKIAGNSIGVISAVDDAGATATTDERYAYFNILRAQRDFGGQSRAGMVYTDRIQGADYNRVGSVDGRHVFGRYSASGQIVGSLTSLGGTQRDGALWNGVFARSGKRFGLRYSAVGIDPDFITQTGFVSRAGVVHTNASNSWTWYGAQGARLESFTFDFTHDYTWQYRKFTRHGDAQDKKWHFSTSATLRGGWVVGTGVFWESFGYDQQLYSGYQIERAVNGVTDTIPFVGVARIPNRDYVLTLATPQFAHVDGNVLYVWGQDENFLEWAQADINFISAEVNVRPTQQLRINGTYNYNDYIRRTDRTYAGRNIIPRLKAEYQLTRAIFVRAVGEYDAFEHDDLRDVTRTEYPLIIDGVKALAEKIASFHGDYLFSYRPNPGTVLFAGYGSELRGDPNPADRFRYQRMIRDADHVFVKASYLWRF